MANVEYALFDTPLGRCAVAWTERGVAGLELPDASPDGLVNRFVSRWGTVRRAKPPIAIQKVIDAIVALLSGKKRSLRSVALDLEGLGPFCRKVYEAARDIPPGMTQTYGQLARAAGSPGAARAVGRVLAQNPIALVVPCHRVVGARGQLVGFSASGGVETKRRLLQIEGALQAIEAGGRT